MLLTRIWRVLVSNLERYTDHIDLRVYVIFLDLLRQMVKFYPKWGHEVSFRIHRSFSSGNCAVCSSRYWKVSRWKARQRQWQKQSRKLGSWHLTFCFFIRCQVFLMLSDHFFFLPFCLLQVFFTFPVLSFLLSFSFLWTIFRFTYFHNTFPCLFLASISFFFKKNLYYNHLFNRLSFG